MELLHSPECISHTIDSSFHTSPVIVYGPENPNLKSALKILYTFEMAYFFRYISLFTLFNLFNPDTSAGKIEFEVYGGPLARIFADCLHLCCKKIALPHGYTLKYLQKHPADNYNIEQYPLKQVHIGMFLRP